MDFRPIVNHLPSPQLRPRFGNLIEVDASKGMVGGRGWPFREPEWSNGSSWIEARSNLGPGERKRLSTTNMIGRSSSDSSGLVTSARQPSDWSQVSFILKEMRPFDWPPRTQRTRVASLNPCPRSCKRSCLELPPLQQKSKEVELYPRLAPKTALGTLGSRCEQ